MNIMVGITTPDFKLYYRRRVIKQDDAGTKAYTHRLMEWNGGLR